MYIPLKNSSIISISHDIAEELLHFKIDLCLQWFVAQYITS